MADATSTVGSNDVIFRFSPGWAFFYGRWDALKNEGLIPACVVMRPLHKHKARASWWDAGDLRCSVGREKFPGSDGRRLSSFGDHWQVCMSLVLMSRDDPRYPRNQAIYSLLLAKDDAPPAAARADCLAAARRDRPLRAFLKRCTAEVGHG